MIYLFYGYLTEVYLSIDPEPQSRTPIWMFNDRLEVNGGIGWLHLPMKILHPCEIPPNLRLDFAVVFLVTGPPEPIVKASIRSGIFLTVKQLKSLISAYKISVGPKGSGKDGRLVKQDFAKAVVTFFFPDATSEEQKRMIEGLMGRSWKHLSASKGSKHSADILKAFGAMDPEDKREYIDIAEVAEDEELLKQKRDIKERHQIDSKADRKHMTPTCLRHLLPPYRQCRITRHPALKRYQAFYSSLIEIEPFFFLNPSVLVTPSLFCDFYQ